MSTVDLTKSFSDDVFRRALEDWAWLPVAGKRPFLASLFGDVFLEDGSGIWMLDVLEGSLDRVFSGRQEMAAVLGSEEGREKYLLDGLAAGAAGRLGLSPGPDQILAWKLPPVLGAPVTVDNLQLMGFEVYLSLQGQLHRQVKDLPPGTRISGFTIDGDRTTARP